MRKFVSFFFAAAFLFAGCAKEIQTDISVGDGAQTVTFDVGLSADLTKAVTDGDGAGAKINHWVIEVLDADGERYLYEEDNNAPEGVLTHSFTVTLVKDHKYNIMFWADTRGTYNVTSLENVELIAAEASGYAACKDSRDAFCAVETNFVCTQALTKAIKMKRPFAQMNIIFTDLAKLYAALGSSDTEYAQFKPSQLKIAAKVPTNFNVNTQTAGEPSATALTMTADENYLDNFSKHRSQETLFMDYFFASSDTKDIVNLDFSFEAKGSTISYSFASVPFQRNYRTNILGEFMDANARWSVVTAVQ